MSILTSALTGVFTWKVKAVLGAVAILAIFFAFRWGLNAHDGRVYQEGRAAMAVEMEKTKQLEWKSKEAVIAQDAAKIVAARTQLETDRAALNRNLQDGIRAIRNERQHINETVNSVPDSERIAAIRAVLRELSADR